MFVIVHIFVAGGPTQEKFETEVDPLLGDKSPLKRGGIPIVVDKALQSLIFLTPKAKKPALVEVEEVVYVGTHAHIQKPKSFRAFLESCLKILNQMEKEC